MPARRHGQYQSLELEGLRLTIKDRRWHRVKAKWPGISRVALVAAACETSTPLSFVLSFAFKGRTIMELHGGSGLTAWLIQFPIELDWPLTTLKVRVRCAKRRKVDLMLDMQFSCERGAYATTVD
jgi:hypothetical protein